MRAAVLICVLLIMGCEINFKEMREAKARRQEEAQKIKAEEAKEMEASARTSKAITVKEAPASKPETVYEARAQPAKEEVRGKPALIRTEPKTSRPTLNPESKFSVKVVETQSRWAAKNNGLSETHMVVEVVGKSLHELKLYYPGCDVEEVTLNNRPVKVEYVVGKPYATMFFNPGFGKGDQLTVKVVYRLTKAFGSVSLK